MKRRNSLSFSIGGAHCSAHEGPVRIQYKCMVHRIINVGCLGFIQKEREVKNMLKEQCNGVPIYRFI